MSKADLKRVLGWLEAQLAEHESEPESLKSEKTFKKQFEFLEKRIAKVRAEIAEKEIEEKENQKPRTVLAQPGELASLREEVAKMKLEKTEADEFLIAVIGRHGEIRDELRTAKSDLSDANSKLDAIRAILKPTPIEVED